MELRHSEAHGQTTLKSMGQVRNANKAATTHKQAKRTQDSITRSALHGYSYNTMK